MVAPPDKRPLPDVEGRASAYVLAQVSGERKGLTLHTDTLLEQCRQLQDHARAARDREPDRSRDRARRVALLAIATAALDLSAWLALLSQR